MEAIREQINRIRNLKINNILYDILSDKRIQKFIIELNTKEQLFNEGVNSNNVIIGRYTPSTYEDKIRKFDASFPRHYTLLDTGEFYESFEIIVQKEAFIITADGQKEDDNLFEKYGDDIVGLTEESMTKLIEKLKPLIIDQIHDSI